MSKLKRKRQLDRLHNGSQTEHKQGRFIHRVQKQPPRKTESGTARHPLNAYQGWTVLPGHATEQLSRETLKYVEPKKFWAKYISQRRPAVLAGDFEESLWGAAQEWTLDYLAEKSGNCMVTVEKRNGPGESFGKGCKIHMLFKDFLGQLKLGNQNLYLTTQEVDEAHDGLPGIAAPPVSQLTDDVGIRPALLGNLIPQQINLWMGSSSTGASSGLHHDFHDNLYVLLRGCKRFRLWSPRHAERMHTHGSISRVHANGRIVYEGEGEILADGSSAGELETKRSHCIKTKQVTRSRRETAANSDAESAELEAALDRAIEQCDMDSGSSGDWDSHCDDYEDSPERDMDRGARQQGHPDPPSFSRVDLTREPTEIAVEFPDFPGEAQAVSCTLNAGEVLYLPAGWFHEVTSLNGDDDVHSDTPSVHMALNYWFHPPDNLDPVNGHRKPYLRPFWPDMWKRQQQHI